MTAQPERRKVAAAVQPPDQQVGRPQEPERRRPQSAEQVEAALGQETRQEDQPSASGTPSRSTPGVPRISAQ